MNLDFVRIETDIAATADARLPAVFYDALRSFEAQIKVICCSTVCDSCTACSQRDACPYQRIFAQELSPDPEVIRTHQKPSLPFSLYIDVKDGDTSSVTLGIVIVGSAVNYVDIFHSALLRLIHLCLSGIQSPLLCSPHFYTFDYQGVRHKIDSTGSLSNSIILLSGQHILLNTVHSDHIKLSLKSPLRLLNNGLIAHHFDFASFFRSQLRRCSSLCAYYGSGELVLDYVNLSQAAQNVAVLEDEMHYTRPPWSTRHSKPGLIGSVECSGLVEPMYALLLLGSYFNAGKGAAYGSGFYSIEVL